MRPQPSVLLIDDSLDHEANLRSLDLDADGWVVEAAIDRDLDKAYAKAIKAIDAQRRKFTVIILDIMWPGEGAGGIKILGKLIGRYRKVPAHQILFVTRGSALDQPEVLSLLESLQVPIGMRKTLQFDTEHGRKELKKALQRCWRGVQAKKAKLRKQEKDRKPRENSQRPSKDA